MAFLFAKRATCDRLNVGCVIVKDKRPITGGYNGPPMGMWHCKEAYCNTELSCTRSVHAEANAIAWAAKAGVSLDGATIYCTHAPCKKCAELIIQAGIKEVVYAIEFRDREGLRLLLGLNIRVTNFEHDQVDENEGLAFMISTYENKIQDSKRLQSGKTGC